jgi:hypothetical protein
MRNDARSYSRKRGPTTTRPWAAQADAVVTLMASVAAAVYLISVSDLQATSGLSDDDMQIYQVVIRETEKRSRGVLHVVNAANTVPFIEAWPHRVRGLHGVYRRAVFDLNNKCERNPDLSRLSELGYTTVDCAVEFRGRKKKIRPTYVWLSAVGYNRRAATAVVMAAYRASNRQFESGLYLLVFEYGRWDIEDYIEIRKR